MVFAATSGACTTASSSMPLLQVSAAGIATRPAICSWVWASWPARLGSLQSMRCTVAPSSALSSAMRRSTKRRISANCAAISPEVGRVMGFPRANRGDA